MVSGERCLRGGWVRKGGWGPGDLIAIGCLVCDHGWTPLSVAETGFVHLVKGER